MGGFKTKRPGDSMLEATLLQSGVKSPRGGERPGKAAAGICHQPETGSLLPVLWRGGTLNTK
jgi:hypothetical protein